MPVRAGAAPTRIAGSSAGQRAMGNKSSRASRWVRFPSASAGRAAALFEPVELDDLADRDRRQRVAMRPFLIDLDRKQIADTADVPTPSASDLAQIKAICDRRIDAHWQHLAQAWGAVFSGADRADIKTIADAYLAWEPFERNAPFIKDGLARLKRIDRSARRFWGALLQGDQGDLREAARQAELAIERHFHPSGSDTVGSYDDMVHRMSDFIRACGLAQRELAALGQSGGFKEGDAWREMIGALVDWSEPRELPTRISKGRARSKGDPRPSPFVAFVWELQRHFPTEHQRHMQSLDALATAMNAARAAWRRRGPTAGA